MAKYGITIIFLIIFLGNICFASSSASYLFQRQDPKEYIADLTMDILKKYNIPITSYSSEKGRIETDFALINRNMNTDFPVKYVILIEQKPYGTQINVTATVREHTGEVANPRTEIKSAWWLIKALVLINALVKHMGSK